MAPNFKTVVQLMAIEWHDLPADKTETDDQVLDWDTSKAFIAGAYAGRRYYLGNKLSLWDLIKLWWGARGH